MTQTIEFDLAKVLERIDQRLDRIEHKVDKVIESGTKHEEQIKSLQKGQEETKDISKDIKGRVACYTDLFVIRAHNFLNWSCCEVCLLAYQLNFMQSLLLT